MKQVLSATAPSNRRFELNHAETFKSRALKKRPENQEGIKI